MALKCVVRLYIYCIPANITLIYLCFILMPFSKYLINILQVWLEFVFFLSSAITSLSPHLLLSVSLSLPVSLPSPDPPERGRESASDVSADIQSLSPDREAREESGDGTEAGCELSGSTDPEQRSLQSIPPQSLGGELPECTARG